MTPNVDIWTPPVHQDQAGQETGKAAQIYPACDGHGALALMTFARRGLIS
jgi:hypothetical protein